MSDSSGETQRRLDRVRRVSKWLKWLSAASAMAILAIAIALFVWPPWLAHVVNATYPTVVQNAAPAGSERVMLALLACAPLGLMLYTVSQLRALFAAYEQGHIFAATAADRLRRAGAAMVLSAPVQIVVHTLGVLVLTYDNPPGQRMLSIELSSTHWVFALFGSLLIVIGWVMYEAAALSEENRQFV